MNPKTFVSYAGEDREFVEDFCTKLRSRGVDPWYSGWEILPGDRLVRKIFDEGLENAQAVIVILSRHSVDKPWVQEELDAAVVKRISDGTRLIPVVIDGCDVPFALRSTAWEKIPDLNNYEAELARIVMAIYGHYEKPPLGEQPAYMRAPAVAVPGLTQLDSLILRFLGDEVIEEGRLLLNTSGVLWQAGAFNVPRAEIYDGLDALQHAGYFRTEKVESPEDPIIMIEFTVYGFEQYARTFVQGYGDITRVVVSQVVNTGARDTREIAATINQPPIIVEHVFHLLAQQRLVEIAEYETGALAVLISPQLKRYLRDSR